MVRSREINLYISVTFAVLAISLAPWVARGQTVAGALHGTVTDASGAVVPGTKIVVQNEATGAMRQVTTNNVGFYTVTQLPPGRYNITVTKSGFTTLRQSNVQLLVNQDLELDFSLKLGAVTQEVQVTATPSLLQTSSATVGQVVGSQQVEQLPLNGRQFTQLVLLTPGAAPKEGGQQASFTIPIGGGGISPSVNGQRGQQNNFTLDGILNNAIFTNTWAISPPPDAIQEFKVQSYIIDAEFGISSGANINVVTKTGSSKFHGDVWEFLRNKSLDAANFFTNRTHGKKPPFAQNQFGFTMGGPVVLPKWNGRKHKTYFFGYYEGFRERQGFTLFNSVPTPQELNGDFSGLLTNSPVLGANGQPVTDPLGRTIYQGQIYDPYSTRQVTAGQVDPVTGLTAQTTGLVRDPFGGNMIPQEMLNAAALRYINAFYPKPNLSGGLPNFVGPENRAINSNQGEIKIDQTFSNNDTLMGAFYRSRANDLAPTTLLLGQSALINDADQVAIGYTHVFGPTFLMALHYGFTKTNFDSTNVPAGADLLTATHQDQLLPERNGVPIVPQISLAPRLGGTGQFAIPLGPIRSNQGSADFQKIYGSHTISGGLMFYQIHSFDDGWGMSVGFDQFPTSAISGPGTNESATGDGLASALLNLPSSLFGFLGATEADLTTTWKSFYLQDKWQVSKKLTLQIGTRYDYVPPMHWKDNKISGFDVNCGTVGCFLISQPFPPTFPNANVRPTYFDPRYGGIQPRFGISYRLLRKDVIRAGFSLFDDHNNSLVQNTQAIRIKWPYAAGVSLGALNRGIPGTFFDNPPPASSFFPTPGQPAVPQLAFTANPRNKIPTSAEWNFTLEHAFTPNASLTVAYLGSQSRHLYITPERNAPLPGPGPISSRAPNPQFGQFPGATNEGIANYNALQAKGQVRRHGMNLLMSYTWSHCFSISDSGESSNIQNPYNWHGTYGSCDFDFRHLFTFSGVYELPFGRGRHFGSAWNGAANGVLGGWRTSWIWNVRSGAPFSVIVPFDNANIGSGSQQRANQVGNPLPPGFTQSIDAWLDPAAFAVPAAFTFGNSSKNAYRGPHFNSLDFSLSKDFQLTESRPFGSPLRLEFRSDLFNIFNNVNFSPPGGGASGGFSILGGATSTAIGSGSFLQIFDAAAAREIQFSLKLMW